MKISTKYKLGSNERAGGSTKHRTERANDQPSQKNGKRLKVAVDERRNAVTKEKTKKGTKEQRDKQTNETNKRTNEIMN